MAVFEEPSTDPSAFTEPSTTALPPRPSTDPVNPSLSSPPPLLVPTPQIQMPICALVHEK
eukprot:447558-Pelagomonas_calceolata.AAC.4